MRRCQLLRIGALATLVAAMAGFLYWRHTHNQHRRLMAALHNLALAIQVHVASSGSFPAELGALADQYDISRDVVQKTVYVMAETERAFVFAAPKGFPENGEVWFFYPLDERRAWLCVEGAIGEGEYR